MKLSFAVTNQSYANVGSGRTEKAFVISDGDTLVLSGKAHTGGRSLRTGMSVSRSGWSFSALRGLVHPTPTSAMGCEDELLGVVENFLDEEIDVTQFDFELF